MTVKAKRIARGKATQHIAAAWYQGRGWPLAEAVGNGRAGRDITGLPGLFCEVKAESEWRPTTWLRQHRAAVAVLDVPLWVVERPDGYGPTTVARWPVVMTYAQAVALLAASCTVMEPCFTVENDWRPTLTGPPFPGCYIAQRPYGYGHSRLAEWPVIMTLETHTAALHAAGYGSGGDQT